jgi:aspartyl-tRNA(Asn)/glutamyl-tRNA(Gln) amidotransferase subunit B
MKYDVIIGLEIHAELKTKSKMFCSCLNNPEEKKQNQNVCPICLGHPGTLPVPNWQAIKDTILIGLALAGRINRVSKFDRKNYFYPDLPKGYQISQYDLPFVYQACLELDREKIDITRIHLEEDTGKLLHEADSTTIDFNRAGTPLVELVTEPVIKDAESAKRFCQKYQQILRYLEVSDADMEKGQMRCEVNISLQERKKWEYKNGKILAKGRYKLNPKIEVKNINSFKAVEKAINYEIERQTKALDKGEKLYQETRGWNETKGQTISQRKKEDSADYRYFPEPDIPAIKFSFNDIENLKARLVELPEKKKKRFKKEYKLNDDLIERLTADKKTANWFEEVISELRNWEEDNGDDWERQNQKLSLSAANWIISELFRYLPGQQIEKIKITPENMAELICLVYNGTITYSTGQKILEIMFKKGGDPSHIIDELDLKQLDNDVELEKIIKTVIAKNPSQAEEYKQGKTALFQYFVGQTMAVTKGKANPKTVAEILKKLL